MEELNKAEFLVLLEKLESGTATPEERNFLEAYYQAFGLRKNISESLSSRERQSMQEEIYARLTDQAGAGKSAEIVQLSVPAYRRWLRLGAAAAILLILGAGLFYYRGYLMKPEQQTAQNIIRPGGNKAILTLSNGQRVSLTDAARGDIARQAGITIRKTADGQLVYEVSDEAPSASPDEYNTIETPAGGQYQVRLPDGTEVWLNAASSLKYPASFAAQSERRVQLSGEAYFEVSKDPAHPFIVKTAAQEVRVLGTHFNVNAYAEEEREKTTLLEGKVAVTAGDSKTELLPGQQATESAGLLKVQEVNAAYAVAWKDGYFRFDGKTLETGMREIARWYNVNLTFKNPELKNEPLAGTISKYSSITSVLKTMELTGAFHFEVKNRDVVIQKP